MEGLPENHVRGALSSQDYYYYQYRHCCAASEAAVHISYTGNTASRVCNHDALRARFSSKLKFCFRFQLNHATFPHEWSLLCRIFK